MRKPSERCIRRKDWIEVQSLAGDFGVKALDVFPVLENTSQRIVNRFFAQFMSIHGDQSGRPIQRLGNAGTLVEIHKSQALDQTADLLDEKSLDFGDLRSNDRILFFETRVINPVIEAAPFQRVMDLSRAIRGQDHVGRFLGADRSELGYGDLKVGENLEQKRFKLHVRPVNFVDEQNRWYFAIALNGFEQWPSDQIFFCKDLWYDRLTGSGLDLVLFDPQYLLRIIPFVQRGVAVQPLVTLKANQGGVQDVGQDLCDLGFTDAGFSFQQNRLTHHHGQINNGGQRAVANIAALFQSVLDFFNRELELTFQKQYRSPG